MRREYAGSWVVLCLKLKSEVWLSHSQLSIGVLIGWSVIIDQIGVRVGATILKQEAYLPCFKLCLKKWRQVLFTALGKPAEWAVSPPAPSGRKELSSR